MDSKAQKAKPRWLIPVLAALLAIIVLLVILLFRGCEPTVDVSDDPPPLGYAADATVADNANELQEIADKLANENGVTLEYSNAAISTDGKTVTCYVANAAENEYDMYFGVYADADFTDELYLSQLLRPGTALREITLNRAMEPGNYQIYVAETQVGDVDGVQTIMNQVFHTIELQVRG